MPKLHTVAETQGFISDCNEEGVSEEKRREIVEAVAGNPTIGDLVQGSGGIIKRRFAGRGKGKSSGYRVMIAYLGEDAPAYLLALLGKGTRANFDDAEVKEMKRLTTQLKRHWRIG